MHARNQEFLHASRVTRPRVWTGLLLNESYKVGSLIEQGATTELYDGTEVSTGEPVALKILLPQLAEDAKTRDLFVDEARVLTRLTQPGLLRYRACAKDTQFDLTYIVTDVVATRLSSRMAVRRPSQQDVVGLTKRLALALGAVHRAGVVHRGLRPHAIALPGGQLADATITDFNLIKAAHSGLNRAFDDAMVDPAYCAPEQLSTSNIGSTAVGPWTDIYSLALVILFAIGGKAGDAGSEASADLSLLPRKLRPVFAKMLEPLPARRFQSMDEVVKQLDLALESAPLQILLNRAQAIRLPRFRRTGARESGPQPVQAIPAPAKAAPPIAARLPPLPESLRPAKTVPLAKFHEARASIGLGGVALRAAVALSALLLAATPWIVQTSLPRAPADASTVASPAQVRAMSKAAPALLQGRVYGADNTYSSVTLRIHRPTRVTVYGRGERLLFSRALEPGDLYRAPSLPDLTVSADDAGAVEVLFDGASAGFAGQDGASVQQAPLRQLASVTPAPTQSKPAQPRAPAAPAPEAPPAEPEAVVESDPPVGTPVEATASDEAPVTPTEPASPPAPPEQSVAQEPPQPPVPLEIAPSPPIAVVDVPAPSSPPPEARRTPILDFLLPWRANRAAASTAEQDTDPISSP